MSVHLEEYIIYSGVESSESRGEALTAFPSPLPPILCTMIRNIQFGSIVYCNCAHFHFKFAGRPNITDRNAKVSSSVCECIPSSPQDKKQKNTFSTK